MNKQSRLGTLLLSKGLITRTQLDTAVALQGMGNGKALGRILIEQGAIRRQQLNRALWCQALLRKFTFFMALIVAPFQLAMAKDLSPFPTEWDQRFGVDAVDFSGDMLSKDPYRNYYLPVTVSIGDIKAAYTMLTHKGKQPIIMQGLAEPVMQQLQYNLEMNIAGGMRLNLQYRF